MARDIGLYCRENGYEVDYLLFGETVKGYDDELIDNGCRMIHIPAPSSGYLRFYRKLIQLIRENHYDVVHAHTMFSCGWAMLAAKQCGVPVRVAHAHSALNDGRSVKKSVYEQLMRRLILRNATDLVACGDAAGIRLFGRTAYEKRGKKILNGIDVDQFSYSEEARNRIREELQIRDAFVIGHVGHLAQVKNQAFLIRLMPQILQKKPNAVLLLLGEGEDRPKLEQMIQEAKLKDRVIMTGNVRNVSDYLSAMDVFAFPSIYEGMPLSIIEVQANGLPCVISTGVPRDVYLTDLIKPLALNQASEWGEAICMAKRNAPWKYAIELKSFGLDSSTILSYYSELYSFQVKC